MSIILLEVVIYDQMYILYRYFLPFLLDIFILLCILIFVIFGCSMFGICRRGLGFLLLLGSRGILGLIIMRNLWIEYGICCRQVSST